MRGSIKALLAGIVTYSLIEQSLAFARLRASQHVTAAKEDQETKPCEKDPLKPFQTPPVNVTPPDPKALQKSGDLVRKVKSQLASDHRTLGKVSAALMAVQTSVDKTEQSMLGKVLDLQTARSFFTRHGEINTANEKLHDDVEKMNKQVEGLSSNLYKTQKHFLDNGHQYRKVEAELHSEIVENQALIDSINAELAKEDDVKKALDRLTKIHDHLQDEAIDARKAGLKATKLLNEQRFLTRAEVQKHRDLRHQLVAMNNYSVACHAKVEKKSKELQKALVKESKDNKAAVMTMKQKKKANVATQQRLLAERALLVSEVKRVEAEEVDMMGRVKDLREDMVVLQNNIVDEVRKTKAAILAEKERIKSLTASLMENAQAIEEDKVKMKTINEERQRVAQKLHDEQNPVIIATIQGQNAALKAELDQAYVMWQQVKAAETKATLNQQQAQAEVDAAKNAVSLAEQEVTSAREQGEKQLAEAVKKAMASEAKAEALIQKAQAALSAKCKTKWDAISAKKDKKLEKCKGWEDELSQEQAKKQLLEQTLKARAESS